MTTNPSQHTHTDLGVYGEELAAEALANAGYQILERNWQTTVGEVDIIAYHRHQLVAIEVKTRTGTGYGDPLAAMTASQLRRIQRGLLHFKRSVYPKYAHTAIRVDLVGLEIDEHGDANAELIQDVS